MKFIQTIPNKEKSKSIMLMVKNTLSMINSLNKNKFTSHIVKEYYNVIREMISVILLLDGYKIYGDGAYLALIDYLGDNYDIRQNELSLIKDLRNIRNKINYDGFFVKIDYLKIRENYIKQLISKLQRIIKNK